MPKFACFQLFEKMLFICILLHLLEPTICRPGWNKLTDLQLAKIKEILFLSGKCTEEEINCFKFLSVFSQEPPFLLIAGELQKKTYTSVFYAVINCTQQPGTLSTFREYVKEETFAGSGVPLLDPVQIEAEKYAKRDIAKLPDWKSGKLYSTAVAQGKLTRPTIEKIKIHGVKAMEQFWIASEKLCIMLYGGNVKDEKCKLIAYSTVRDVATGNLDCFELIVKNIDNLVDAEETVWTLWQKPYAFEWFELAAVYGEGKSKQLQQVVNDEVKAYADWIPKSEELLFRVALKTIYAEDVYYVGEYLNSPEKAFFIVKPKNGKVKHVGKIESPEKAVDYGLYESCERYANQKKKDVLFDWRTQIKSDKGPGEELLLKRAVTLLQYSFDKRTLKQFDSSVPDWFVFWISESQDKILIICTFATQKAYKAFFYAAIENPILSTKAKKSMYKGLRVVENVKLQYVNGEDFLPTFDSVRKEAETFYSKW